MASCDVQTLLDDATCFMAVQPFTLQALQAQLLCNIEAAVPTSGTNFLSGNGSPEGVVTGEVQGQTYLDLDSGALYSFGGTVGTNTGWV